MGRTRGSKNKPKQTQEMDQENTTPHGGNSEINNNNNNGNNEHNHDGSHRDNNDQMDNNQYDPSSSAARSTPVAPQNVSRVAGVKNPNRDGGGQDEPPGTRRRNPGHVNSDDEGTVDASNNPNHNGQGVQGGGGGQRRQLTFHNNSNGISNGSPNVPNNMGNNVNGNGYPNGGNGGNNGFNNGYGYHNNNHFNNYPNNVFGYSHGNGNHAVGFPNGNGFNNGNYNKYGGYPNNGNYHSNNNGYGYHNGNIHDNGFGYNNNGFGYYNGNGNFPNNFNNQNFGPCNGGYNNHNNNSFNGNGHHPQAQANGNRNGNVDRHASGNNNNNQFRGSNVNRRNSDQEARQQRQSNLRQQQQRRDDEENEEDEEEEEELIGQDDQFGDEDGYDDNDFNGDDDYVARVFGQSTNSRSKRSSGGNQPDELESHKNMFNFSKIDCRKISKDGRLRNGNYVSQYGINSDDVAFDVGQWGVYLHTHEDVKDLRNYLSQQCKHFHDLSSREEKDTRTLVEAICGLADNFVVLNGKVLRCLMQSAHVLLVRLYDTTAYIVNRSNDARQPAWAQHRVTVNAAKNISHMAIKSVTSGKGNNSFRNKNNNNNSKGQGGFRPRFNKASGNGSKKSGKKSE